MEELKRCTWVGDDPLMIEYHDTEWGVPVYDDKKLFEFIVLDTMQAGLSWRTVLNKRTNFRKAFSNFDPVKVAKYGAAERRGLLKDAGIIRNRQKIEAIINNAQKHLEVQQEFGNFSKYLWQFVGGKPIVNRYTKDSEIGATSRESEAMSKDMKNRGFKFVGPTICYAFMQGAGLVNDHLLTCFRYRQPIDYKTKTTIPDFK